MDLNLREFYARIAPRYELVNHLMTLGSDMLWRPHVARAARAAGGDLWLDVCCGTGEMTCLLARGGGRERTVVGADYSLPMMQEGRARRRLVGVQFTVAVAHRLPFADGRFDGVTIAFASRNLRTGPDALRGCLREFCRVLKPGGTLVHLETGRPRSGLVRAAMDKYVGAVVPRIGGAVTGTPEAYAYLAGSIPRFHGAEELADIMRAAGFTEVEFRRLTMGVAAIHVARK